MNHATSRRTSLARRLGLVAGTLLVATLLAGPVLAGHGYGRGRGHGYGHGRGHSHGHHGQVVHRGHSGFVVPHHVYHGDAWRYRQYYHSSVYYAPHRHAHAQYYFPVYSSTGYAYEPYSYCGSERFDGYVGYDGPRVSLHLAF
jgi:hypothetical protein